VFPSELEIVLFDAGGTLVHVDYDFVVELAAREGVALDRARMPHGDAAARQAVDRRLRDVGHGGDSDGARVPHYFEELLLGAGLAAEVAAELAPRVRAAHLEAGLWRVPFPDAAEALAALRGAGLATAVVSNADGRVRAILDEAGLLGELDYVIDSHEEGVEKPDPEIFRRALVRSGAEPARALYVGDIYAVDVLGARAAGIAGCLLDPLGAYGDVDCARVASLAELAERLVGTR
jgi:putative hydrolase of the HAD superfamily